MAKIDGPSFGPANGGKPAGLVVMCHGLGSNGADLIGIAPVWGRGLPHLQFRSPNAPERFQGSPGYQWFPLWERTHAQHVQGAAAAATVLNQFIDDELQRLGLPADAYVLMGFSQGAMMVLHTGLGRAVPPRAILAYSGRLVDERVLEKPAQTRVLLVHGEDDAVVPPDCSRLAAKLLAESGVKAELVICPQVAHGIDQKGILAGFNLLSEVFGTAL